MKILIIIDDLRFGGTENVLASRISELKSDVEFTVLTLFELGPMAERIEKMGIDVEFLDMKNMGISKTFRQVTNIIQAENFDAAVCMRDVTRALFPRFLKKHIAKVAMLWDSPKIFRSLKYFPFEWFQAKFSGATPYCSSHNIAEHLLSMYKLKNVPIIPNCYDQKFFKPQTAPEKCEVRNSLRIISVGGIRKEKNYPEKLAIAQLLKNKEIKFKLTIVGDDPESLMQRDILQMNLENEVTATGRSHNIPELLANSDLFLFTSSSEGFPVALLEAMASGVPCVTYNFPSLCEIDKDFANLAVVPQGDREAATKKIIYLSKHPVEYAKLANNAETHVSANFAADQNSKKWIQFIS